MDVFVWARYPCIWDCVAKGINPPPLHYTFSTLPTTGPPHSPPVGPYSLGTYADRRGVGVSYERGTPFSTARSPLHLIRHCPNDRHLVRGFVEVTLHSFVNYKEM